MEVSVHFSDGSSMPLHYISPADYELVTESVNRHVVMVNSQAAPASPQLMALNPGSGHLVKVTLAESRKCQKKKSHTLARTYVNVSIRYTDSQAAGGDLNEKPQNDAASSHHLSNHVIKQLASLPADGMYAAHSEDSVVYGASAAQIYEGEEMLELPAAPWSSTHQTGMYALLAVFSVATLFFVGNCVLFIMRCRQHLPQHASTRQKSSESHAEDWVWLGPETLACNMISMECSRTLLDRCVYRDTTSLLSSMPPAYSGSPATSRASHMSTFKDSERSFRIINNPLEHPENCGKSYADRVNTEDDNASNTAMELCCDRESVTDTPAQNSLVKRRMSDLEECSVPMDYQDLMIYFESLKETVA